MRKTNIHNAEQYGLPIHYALCSGGYFFLQHRPWRLLRIFSFDFSIESIQLGSELLRGLRTLELHPKNSLVYLHFRYRKVRLTLESKAHFRR